MKTIIFSIKCSNIRKIISLFEKFEISEYLTNNALRQNEDKIKILIQYMKDNDIPLLIDTYKGKKLNLILSSSKKRLKDVYGIIMVKCNANHKKLSFK